MSNGAQNCALEICCPPNAKGEAHPNAVAALAKELVHDGLSEDYATPCAEVVLKHYDLAPRGSLHKFKATTARLARENP